MNKKIINNNDNKIINEDINNNIINENNNDYDFDDLNNENKDEENEKYSYECINEKNLKDYIYEGDEEAKIEIILKNNGNEIWPEDAKLVFDRDSSFSTNEIKLKPQKPGEEEKYNIIFKNLGKYPPKEYKSYLWFYANNEILRGNLTLIIKIEKKNNTIKKTKI